VTISGGESQVARLEGLRRKLELKTCIVDLDLLLPHEKTVPERVSSVARYILAAGYVKYPLLVDLDHLVVLDGHHRLEALKLIGARSAPAFLVDYRKGYVQVRSFRKEVRVTKELVLQAGLSGRLLEPKTSRHVLVGVTLPPSFFPLSALMRGGGWCLPSVPSAARGPAQALQ